MILDSIKKINKNWKCKDQQIFQGTLEDDEGFIIVVNNSTDNITECDILGYRNADFQIKSKISPYYSLINESVHLLIISPYTELHIKKYQPPKYKEETYEEHLEHLKSQKLSCDWVQEIIEGKSDPILKETDDLLLTVNWKWDGKSVDNLYLLAFFKDKKIYTLREVNLEMAEKMKKFILESAKEMYDIDPDQLVLYFHYKPTYYHCHVHINNLKGNVHLGMVVGRAILLDDVIESLKSDPDFYKKRKIFYIGT